MVRDMELARKILMQIEENSSSGSIINLKVDGYDTETISQHCKWLSEKGFVSYTKNGADNITYMFTVGPLTWAGCDYLDKIRDENRWIKIKNWIKEKGVPFTIEAVKDALIALI